MTHREYCAERVMQKGLYLERLEGHSSTPQHSHNYFEFVYVLHGRALHYTENKKAMIKEGDYFLIDINQSHGYETATPNEEFAIINCMFMPSFLDNTLGNTAQSKGLEIQTKTWYNKPMDKQMSMSFLHDELKEVSTHKKEFLERIERIMPWGEMEKLIRPYYYEGKYGNKPYDLELMIRIHLLQNLYDLSDMGARNEVIDSRAFSDFCRVESSNQIPDGDTIGKFRNLLIQNGIHEKFFAMVVRNLTDRGLILKKGTIVDSTIISAPTSTKNKEKKRDPDAHSVKKGTTWYFGYRAHIGVDKDTGLVHHVKVTAANVSDVKMTSALLMGDEEEVYGDSGYLGAEKQSDAIIRNRQGKKIRYKQNRKPSQIKKLSGSGQRKARKAEHEKSSVRAKVEHVFAVIKGQFRYRKTRYRGLRKQTAKLNMLFALANLVLADRHCLPV